jgi:hypothetical protein
VTDSSPLDPKEREPGATLHDIAQGITVKAALRYSRVSLEEIAEILADQWRTRGSDLADLQETHRMMCNGVNVAQAGTDARIAALEAALRETRNDLLGLLTLDDFRIKAIDALLSTSKPL